MTTRRAQTGAETETPIEIDETLVRRRLVNWRQTPTTRLAGADDAPAMIERLGVVTHFPVSPEVPNLFHAFMGDPDAAVDSGHDSPSGHVYTWRWQLGRMQAGFYGTIVRNRPTWVAWHLVPAVLRLRGEQRAAGELYGAGELSASALRVAGALEEAGGALSTGELRLRAGFPTGKENRAAFLKALDELDRRLMVAKVFASDSTDMSHALVRTQYPALLAAAEKLASEDALAELLRAYLPHAVYVVPSTLAKHVGLSEPELRAALARLEEEGRLYAATRVGTKGPCYVWHEN